MSKIMTVACDQAVGHSFFQIYCIHWIASGGYYRLHMSTLLPQCVEIFSLPLYRGQGIIGRLRLLKFAGYIHNHKILVYIIFLASF